MVKQRSRKGIPDPRPAGNEIAQNSALLSATPISTVLQDEVGVCKIPVKRKLANQSFKLPATGPNSDLRYLDAEEA